MKEYYYYKNPNPLKKEVGDCVVRALSIASGKDWDTVYTELCKIGFEIKDMPNCKGTYEAWFKQNGFKYTGISNKKGTKRPTVLSFTKLSKNSKYVVVVANHLVAVVKGVYYDLWDSGDKSLYGYWELIE